MHSICFNWIQYNLILIQLLNSIQFNLNPIVEFTSIENKLNWFQISFTIFEFKFKSSCIAMLFMLQFHIRMNSCLSFQEYLEIFLVPQGYFLLPFYFMVLFLVQIRNIYCVLHIVSYHHYPLIEINLYQNHFNMSQHWHMNMCCLIRVHVNMLTLFKRFLTKVYMSMQKGIMK